jgi:hypothetical protein
MYPAQIWGDFMTAALRVEPEIAFVPPNEALWPRGGSVSEAGRSAYRPRPRPQPQPAPTTAAPAPPAVQQPPPTVAPRGPRTPRRPRPPKKP